MKILQSRPDTAKINGEPVKGNLLKIKKSVIRVDKFLKKDLTKSQRESEKLRKSIEKSSRLKKEKRVETKDNDTKKAFVGKVRVPSLGIFGSLKKFIGTVVLGFFAIKLIPLLPKLIPIVNGLGKFVNFIIGIGGRFLNGFISLVDFGVRAGDATIGFIKNIGGEKTAEVFSKFGGALSGLLDAAILIGTLSLFESGQDYMFDQKNRKPKGPKGRGPLKGVKRSLRRTSLRTIGKTGTKTLGKFGKAGPLAAIFTAFDFMGRKSEGQSNLQAGLGSGSSLAGYAAGAKIGASIGTVGGPPGILIGGLVGGVIGSFIGSSISDKVTGADKVQKRNEGGLVKRKEQDRFKSKEQTLKVGGSISPIKFDSTTEKIFPNDVDGMPESGKYISNSFKDVSKTSFLGPLMGLSYKMLTGQGMSNDEFEVASNNLKASAKFGFSPEMLKKSFTDASGKVAGVRSSTEMPPTPRPPKWVTGILDVFGGFKDDGRRTLASTKELESLRGLVKNFLITIGIVVAVMAAVGGAALLGYFNPAVAAFVAKILKFLPMVKKTTDVSKVGKIVKLKNLKTKPLRFKEPVKSTVRTRVQLENTMDPLRSRSVGEDVVGNILNNVGMGINSPVPTGLTKTPIKKFFGQKSPIPTGVTPKSVSTSINNPLLQTTKKLSIKPSTLSPRPTTGVGSNVTTNITPRPNGAPSPNGGFLKFSKRASRIKRKSEFRSRTNDNIRKIDTRDTDKLIQDIPKDPMNTAVRTGIERQTGVITREFVKPQRPSGTQTMTQDGLEKLARQLGLGKKTLQQNFGRKIKKSTPTEGDVLNTPKNFDALDRTFGSRTGFNLGGFVRGAGGTDMIPARLTSGEFVIDKDSTDYLRATMPGFLAGINKAKYDDVLPVLQSYASYESGFGGQDIVVVAPTTEINNVSGQQMASAPMITAGGSGEDPFEILAKG